jgi:hypothetical protein
VTDAIRLRFGPGPGIGAKIPSPYVAMTPSRNHWNPPRNAACVCGWSQNFANLKTAVRAAEQHLADGCEGCDHAVTFEEILTINPQETTS